MKTLKNICRYVISLMHVFGLVAITEIVLSSCTQDELEVQQNFPFEVTIMPVPKDIAKDETVEIRIKINPKATYSETQYFIRYFQFDGMGTLRYFEDPAYSPNDSYPLPQKEFRLYYTSTSAVSQSFKIWISDSFDNEKEFEFQFNSKD